MNGRIPQEYGESEVPLCVCLVYYNACMCESDYCNIMYLLQLNIFRVKPRSQYDAGALCCGDNTYMYTCSSVRVCMFICAGGLGLGILDECIVGEELAYGCTGISTVFITNMLAVSVCVCVCVLTCECVCVPACSHV